MKSSAGATARGNLSGHRWNRSTCGRWTGTNEIMSAMIQHDCYEEFLGGQDLFRDAEPDAMHPEAGEKVFNEADMWRLYEDGA